MSARLLLSKRPKLFALFVSLKTKVFSNQFRVPRAERYRLRSWKLAQSWSKLRCAQAGLGYFLVIVTKGVNRSARLLLRKRSKIFPLSISLKSKLFSNQFRVLSPQSLVLKYLPSCWKSAQSWSKSCSAQAGLGHFLVIVAKGVNVSAILFLSKRSKTFPLSISLKTKVFWNQFRVP